MMNKYALPPLPEGMILEGIWVVAEDEMIAYRDACIIAAIEEVVEPYIETLFKIGEHLGIDYQAARTAPGKPSDVYIAAIEADRKTTKKQLTAYRGLVKSMEARLTHLQAQHDELKKSTNPDLLASERASNAMLTEELEADRKRRGEPVAMTLGQKAVAAELLACFKAWEPMVCVLGNVRARDGADLMQAILNAAPQPAEPDVLPGEAIFGFAAWLTSLENPVTFSCRHGAAIGAELAVAYNTSQGFIQVREDFHKRLKPYPKYEPVKEVTVPDGWKLVPLNATKAMQDAWDVAPSSYDCDQEFHGAYSAMIAAAPTPPADGQAQQESIHLPQLRHAIADITELRQQIELMKDQLGGNVWIWEPEGENHLESMGNRMGVLIYACDLKALLAQAQQDAACVAPVSDKPASGAQNAIHATQPQQIPEPILLHKSMSPNYRNYAKGWNACRAAMLEATPEPKGKL